MKKEMDNKGQGSMLLYLMLFLLIMFIFTSTGLGEALGNYFGLVLTPLIGFNGQYPLITLFCASIIVVTLSSLLTNFFTDWVKMGKSQHISKAFQKEISEARKQGDQKKVQKLMKKQPEIMKKQTQASGGMMKPMLFLIIFIWPIFMWLREFLANANHYYFTVPWAENVSFFGSPLPIGQTWLWIYIIFSIVLGQLIRQGLKYLALSDWWKETKQKILPSNPIK
ncbi:MAG: EMC3/TMCO1 family protein [Candidatus Thermoplasmatota archaeon]